MTQKIQMKLFYQKNSKVFMKLTFLIQKWAFFYIIKGSSWIKSSTPFDFKGQIVFKHTICLLIWFK